MKAVVYEKEREMVVEERPKPKLSKPTEALLRVTTSAICGSDLHMYDGRSDLKEGTVVGHEIMGVIEETGEAVVSIKKGDRVVLPFNIACGYCFNCVRGWTSACLTMNPDTAGAAYGYSGMGPYQGGQAEYVVVPYADFNCLKLPGKPFDEWEDDFVLLADVFPTAYHATELAGVGPGKTVAIFGGGPIGLLSAHCSQIKGASEIYLVDRVPERLQKAKEFGAIPVDFTKGDSVEQIFELRRRNKGIHQSLRPGEEKLKGVECAIDAVGYQANNEKDPAKERPSQVIENCMKVLNATGQLGIIGVYFAHDPGGPNEQAKQGIHPFPIGTVFEKGIQLGSGQAPVKRYNEYLRDLIVNGRAKPSKIVSHRISIDKVPEAYDKFDRRVEGYTKILIRFGEPKTAVAAA
ncbi:MAG TPA: glutathione-independent formaldehyde dehydrogenase [Candidatus Acidoferrales bacterium]|nr:glutathione-independent formaldehyde dehydrogenase [Candidatus Acidoferrales bacterium]